MNTLLALTHHRLPNVIYSWLCYISLPHTLQVYFLVLSRDISKNVLLYIYSKTSHGLKLFNPQRSRVYVHVTVTSLHSADPLVNDQLRDPLNTELHLLKRGFYLTFWTTK